MQIFSSMGAIDNVHTKKGDFLKNVYSTLSILLNKSTLCFSTSQGVIILLWF